MQEPEFVFEVDPDAEPVSVEELVDALAGVLLSAVQEEREE